ncbi:amidohydrolase [Anaerosphaera multitolerans]|uniref:Amidohydrolase n=1 Tax=Anaerosphaera multitolerans TaxID=2487351 RepID=A0A437S996_9FIRM|nr:amidohydrolase [Anaerosphaera multitolerans]RVU55572.1 amidohydrolase [Anaerosphaera multitolerans]
MEKYKNELIALRRNFRQIAEVGWLEMQTTINIIKYLKMLGLNPRYGREIHSENRMGLPSEEIIKEHAEKINTDNLNFDTSEILQGYTGCIVDIKSSKPGKHMGFRFDIDALGLHETDNPEHLPNKLGFRSQDDSTAHACGHDGHIAMGLVLCHWIVDNLENLSGSFRIIFQPAEEGVRGGKSMTEAGATKGLDYMVASHIGMNEESKTLGVGTQGFLATSKFDLTYKGITAHAGANPEDGRNALLAAASATLSLHSLPQYGKGTSRVNVGILKAGSSRNIVPGESYMQIETRGSSEEILQDLSKRVPSVAKGTAETFEVDYELNKVGEAINFETIHPDFVDFMGRELEKRGFKIDLRPNLGGSEDVSYMLKKTETQGGRSIHFLLGTNLKAPHHNVAFDYDEDVLFFGLNAFINTIEILL